MQESVRRIIEAEESRMGKEAWPLWGRGGRWGLTGACGPCSPAAQGAARHGRPTLTGPVLRAHHRQRLVREICQRQEQEEREGEGD